MSDFELFQQLLNSQKEPNSGVFARFYDRAEKTGEINKEGLPIFKDVCFVEIRTKDNIDVYDQPATEEKKQRFQMEYKRYLLAKKQVEKGTPLKQFAFLTAAEIETLNYRGIFTVEALAGLTKEQAENLELSKEHELAVKFLDNAKGNAPLAVLQKKEEEFSKELNKKNLEIEKLTAEIQELKKKLEAAGK